MLCLIPQVLCNNINKLSGGEGEIRTHGRVTPTTIFKTVAFNRSATSPDLALIIAEKYFIQPIII